ncbi:GNAT family N-acetyltransferase [Bacillus cereus group sp. N6]|uniref:GNAT family N-acetyltransferase n=1 Tax=Bacillus cereus group sp. N6 TaxID=2794583 RepID=UPI0018F45AD0|nr:GNAT family N-acetyltransferase [Bacillus cereus group sp. N6]MBJ8113670.1 GNAT family N-acetyltransferase [Bacillus cereus group sp. N6]
MNKLTLKIPTEFSTNRLIIRVPKPEDAMVVHEAICYSIAELKPWIKSLQQLPTRETLEMLIINYNIQFLQRSTLPYLMFSKITGEFIGFAIFHEINWEILKFEVGYWIHSKFSKKGYMTEGVRRLVKFSFEELKANRVEIRCEAANIQSHAIPEKLYFKLEGILEMNELNANKKELSDTYIFAMTQPLYYLTLANE